MTASDLIACQSIDPVDPSSLTSRTEQNRNKAQDPINLSQITQSITTPIQFLTTLATSNPKAATMLLPTLRRSILTTRARAAPLVASRPFSQAPTRLARKDTQDKDSLKPEPNEYSKSGSDDAAAAVEGAAFDPNQTRPEQEHASAAKESGSEVSSSTCFPIEARVLRYCKGYDAVKRAREAS